MGKEVMMAGLSKSRIIQHRQCPKRLWLSVNRPELEEETAAVKARLSAGNNVGEVARGLHPGGILIDTLDSRKALASTIQLLAEKQCPVFEAAFAYKDVLIRPDLLLPVRGGFRMVEVKSSTSVKDYHLEDAAIQSWVATRAGLSLKCIEIAHIDNSFVYPGEGKYDGLFKYANVSDDAASLQKEVPKWVKGAKVTLAGEEPVIEPGDQCSEPFSCPFAGYCSPDPGENVFPPEILPHKNGKKLAAELHAEGYDDLRKVPGERLSSDGHIRIWRVTKSGKAELDPEAGKILKGYPYPRYYLDFETIGFAVPIWPGTRPYRQLPFQWSCHIEMNNGTIKHKEFLAKDISDPRRAFIESLLAALGNEGSVFVYNAGFEAGRLRELAEDFPRYEHELNAICHRIVDLLPLARKHYYHREMRGSWSIKAVLPTIAPELAYDDLDVADGGMAQEAFAEMVHPDTPVVRGRELRQGLLAYCKRDTEALVRVAHFFQGG